VTLYGLRGGILPDSYQIQAMGRRMCFPAPHAGLLLLIK
jgi:hypothetical protein